MKSVMKVVTGLLITGMMCISVASSQVQIRVNSEHHPRHHVVYHRPVHRRAEVQIRVPERHHVVRPMNERHEPDRHDNR
jgi:hypothetical protein